MLPQLLRIVKWCRNKRGFVQRSGIVAKHRGRTDYCVRGVQQCEADRRAQGC